MAEISERQDSNNQVDFQKLSSKINPPAKLARIARNLPGSNSQVESTTPTPADLVPESDRFKGEKLLESAFLGLKTKIAAILVGSVVMLPILAVGTATYYFGSRGVERQAILAKRTNTIELAEAELAREKQLLAALLMGTGTTALLAGAAAAFGTKKLLERISAIPEQITDSQDETETNMELVYDLSQSVARQDFLDTVVEEARICLNCDRVVIYSLDSNNYGAVVAESVAAGYTKALGKTIEDPCFEARYLEKYRDGRIKAIDDVYQAEITPCHLEQLEQLEVKANLVTPIINDEKLFGLLVAHQCESPRQWQSAEIEFLDWLAKKTGFALENARLRKNLERMETEAARERKWTQYFTNAVRYIRQSIKQDDVLEISVEEVRRVLECDRVVIYSLDSNNYGVVVAESVAAGYPRALHKTIEDPCFEARYLDKYRDGRVRAIDNIYEAGMSECYVQQLATLEVKANLVTPILNEGELFGLLVAHQCSQSRHWQDYEIRWMTQIATQVGFALDNAAELRRSHQELPTQLLNNFSLGINERVTRLQLLKTAVEQARQIVKLDRAVVYQFDANWNGKIVAESVVAGYPRAINSQFNDPCFARYREQYRQGRVKAIADVERANLTDCHLEQLKSLAVKASLIVPILQDGKLSGLLIGHQCQQARSWNSWEIELFTQLALQLGSALERLKLREKLKLTELAQNQIEPQPESSALEEKISQLLVENQAVLQAYKAKFARSADNRKDQSDRPSTPPLPMGEVTLEANEIISPPQSNAHNYYPELELITGEIVDKSPSTSNLLLMNQFVGEITNLSERISQQSLYVTKSFQKLAAFAKQLSENSHGENSDNDEPTNY